ncbi:MAG: hypothetical protein ACE5J9_03775 [Methanosarcinales archaeon]
MESAILPGTYVINLIAKSANGTGTATKSFVVKSLRECRAEVTDSDGEGVIDSFTQILLDVMY